MKGYGASSRWKVKGRIDADLRRPEQRAGAGVRVLIASHQHKKEPAP
ncbi:hypothetical protein [Azospirillum endophyticum]